MGKVKLLICANAIRVLNGKYAGHYSCENSKALKDLIETYYIEKNTRLVGFMLAGIRHGSTIDRKDLDKAEKRYEKTKEKLLEAVGKASMTGRIYKLTIKTDEY